MDSSMNFYEEDIRPPDQPKSEQLLQDNRSDFDKQLDEALYQSLQLYQAEVQKHEDLEKKFIQQHREEIEKRKNLVRPILFELNRIRKYDLKIDEVFVMIDSILDSYCGLEFEECHLDKKTYDTIFNGLTKIRINMEFLMSIIKCE
jgi:hypothetical protein